MSLPAWAIAPESGARKPILTDACAFASRATPTDHRTAVSATMMASGRIRRSLQSMTATVSRRSGGWALRLPQGGQAVERGPRERALVHARGRVLEMLETRVADQHRA